MIVLPLIIVLHFKQSALMKQTYQTTFSSYMNCNIEEENHRLEYSAADYVADEITYIIYTCRHNYRWTIMSSKVVVK